MPYRRIAVVSPGDMGHAIGRALVEHGHDVVTCLEGRSPVSRARAARAGMRDVADLAALVSGVDLVLSILPPEAAAATAGEIAAAMKATGARPTYVECNAIAPATTRAIGAVIAAAGAPYIDGGIVGNPPGVSAPTRLYVSGPAAESLMVLDGKGIVIRPCGTEIGRASAIKMCYASITKGANTLFTAALVAAEALGIGEVFQAELAASQPAFFKRMNVTIPRLPADSGRWIAEMDEIATTFASVGVTADFHRGARAVYELLNRTPFAAETRETIDPDRGLAASIRVYARHLTPPP
jgi:3-hydroxyisobutyrate dehydrogenase-like beta-hydroxyacid dehydrogenase